LTHRQFILVSVDTLIDGVTLCKELEERDEIKGAILVGHLKDYSIPEGEHIRHYVGEFYSTPQAVARIHEAAIV